MRLTLRTLLAWIDGVLPDDQRAALGEKVEGSPLARQLVDRIEGALANDRLDAPRIQGKGLVADANTVAEYLDNALAVERLEAFETICLESDIHLAEVAGCHRILAEVARDPAVLAPLDEARRQALLGSIEHRIQGRPEVILSGAAAPESAGNRSAVSLGPRAGGVNLRPVAAEPKAAARRRTPAAAWALLVASLLVVIGLAALFARSVGLLWRPERPQAPVARRGDAPGGNAEQLAGNADEAPPADRVGEGAVIAAAAPAAAGADADPGPPPRGLADLLAQANAADAAAADAAAADTGDGGMTDMPDGADSAADSAADPPAGAAAVPPAFAAGAAGAETALQGPRRVPAGEALAIAAGARPTRAPRAAPAVPAPDVDGHVGADIGADVGLDAPAAGPGIGFVAADGVVLVRVAQGDLVSWEPVGVEGALADGAHVVVPPGLRPEVNLGGVSLRCQPGSILRLALADDGTPRVEVILGRVVCRAARADGRIGILAGDLDGTVASGLDGGVAAEVVARLRPGEGEAGRVSYARVIAVREPLEWRGSGDAAGAVTTIPAGQAIRAPTPTDADMTNATEDTPGWATGTERAEPLERGAADAFLRRLGELPEGSRPAAGLAEVLGAMAIDRRVENRVFAATTLALLGNYDVAADLLCAESPGRRLEGRQWMALESAVVPMALARGAASAERLRRGWEDRGPPGRGALLDLMARRPTDAELEAGADRQLVEALGDGTLVVRRYAAACLDAIVRPAPSDRARYRPDASEESRRDGAAWWRSQQERGAVRRAP